MKILHTSDWHLGRSLYGRKRYDEFELFLDWLCRIINKEKIDLLLIAGDIFDTSTPSNRAAELYYHFLHTVSKESLRQIVVIGGNHDSPSFLNAPKQLLRAMNVHVIGSASDNPEDEVIVINDIHKSPISIVCAVPYLRDKDIRMVQAGETTDDKNKKLIQGLKQHYSKVCTYAENLREELEKKSSPTVPIIAMGHLFTAGGKTTGDDGIRDLYVGSLAHVGKEIFADSIDYVALGHLHVAQRVGGEDHIRYCGSPIPMGFGEAGQTKQVIIVEFNGLTPDIREIDIPVFQPLERIEGSVDKILIRIEQLKHKDSYAWLEIEYTGSRMVDNLRELIENALTGTNMEVRRIKNRQITNRVLRSIEHDETLDDLDATDVFKRCLDTFDIPPEDHKTLLDSYNEILKTINEEDVNEL